MCAALRYLATGANFRTISDYQGISKSTLSLCVKEVVNFLGSLADEYICWPNDRRQLEEKATGFYVKHGKPCTVGVVDGTQIAILRPDIEIEYNYLNRKVYHSLNVMVGIINVIK